MAALIPVLDSSKRLQKESYNAQQLEHAVLTFVQQKRSATKLSASLQLNEELFEALFASVPTMTQAIREQFENLLVHHGHDTYPLLVNGLASTEGAIRSLAAMAIIRLNPQLQKTLRPRITAHKDIPSWIKDFVLSHCA